MKYNARRKQVRNKASGRNDRKGEKRKKQRTLKRNNKSKRARSIK